MIYVLVFALILSLQADGLIQEISPIRLPLLETHRELPDPAGEAPSPKVPHRVARKRKIEALFVCLFVFSPANGSE